jgi:hypothetical protein
MKNLTRAGWQVQRGRSSTKSPMLSTALSMPSSEQLLDNAIEAVGNHIRTRASAARGGKRTQLTASDG